ncbi:hypothetical protein RYX36_014426 [Vicia faba]
MLLVDCISVKEQVLTVKFKEPSWRFLTRRGYATEKQNRLLMVEKLDYFRSKLLETIFSYIKTTSKTWHQDQRVYKLGVNQVPNEELPIWLAAQRAVARYEWILSPLGPRERVLRRLLSWIGLTCATHTSTTSFTPSLIWMLMLSPLRTVLTARFCQSFVKELIMVLELDLVCMTSTAQEYHIL